LILPNKETLPAKIEAFEKLKRRWRKAIKDPDTV